MGTQRGRSVNVVNVLGVRSLGAGCVDPTRLLDAQDRSGVAEDPQGNSDSAETWALRVLETAERYQGNPLRKQRVWVSVSRRAGRSAPRVWRAAMALGVLLCVVGGTAIASAALGHWPAWAVRVYERLAPWSSPSAPSAPSADGQFTTLGRGHRKTRLSPIGSQVTIDATDQNVAAPLDAPDAFDTPAPEPAPVTAPRIRAGGDLNKKIAQRRDLRDPASATRVPPQQLTRMPISEDDLPVLAAMRALRRSKDPVSARALLRDYLAQHPNGALAEEALALSIEAAVANRDSDAGEFAERYLQIYPAGPFRSLARQTLAAHPSH